ncbi:MAG: hypothetical protein J7M24_04735, partial [Candidatus Latescibacteria bacterium]|nr:hypothetical protein [Candidatus Latescibacterota bacterium]
IVGYPSPYVVGLEGFQFPIAHHAFLSVSAAVEDRTDPPVSKSWTKRFTRPPVIERPALIK